MGYCLEKVCVLTWEDLVRSFTTMVQGPRVGLLIRIRVCAGPAFNRLPLNFSGSFNLASGVLFHLLGVL